MNTIVLQTDILVSIQSLNPSLQFQLIKEKVIVTGDLSWIQTASLSPIETDYAFELCPKFQCFPCKFKSVMLNKVIFHINHTFRLIEVA